ILLVEYARELTNAHEDALALTALDEAARRAPAWPLPHLERSRILFDTGDLNGARSASSQALRRSPTDPANVIQRTRVEMAIARSHPFGEDQMQLLTLLDQFVSAAPSNFEFRLAQLELMLRAGQNDKAKLVANRFQESDVELNRYSVESLAALGRIDADIHQRVLASMKSITLPADSYASIPASVTNTVIDDLTPDQRALVAAQTLAVRSDPTASQTWNDLATKAKDEVVLVTVLRDGFDSITDRTTQAALIERVKEITGPDSFNWRVAKMKWLLKSNMEADTREAVGLGTDLVRAAPQLIEGRRLLAKALFRTGNSTYALQHLREAVRLNPTDVKSVSDLVLALAQNGTTADNHTILTTLADQSQLNPNTTATIARLLLANQMKSTAQRFLTRARNAFAIDDSGALLLAEIDASTARQADAKAVFEQLLANNPTPEAIASAAIFFRQIDDESRADALVKKLVEASSRDANYSAALARVHYSNGNVDAARTSWKSALALAPTDRSIAQRAVAFEIDSANYSGATALAGQLLNRFADDTTIVRLRSKAQALATGIEDFAALDRLIESLQSDPEASDQLRVLRAMSALNQVASDDVVGRSKAQVELASALTELARKNPTALQLQTRAIDAQFVAGNREAACELARTMLTAQGNDASFASVATKTLHRAGMIAEARKAAIAWKKIKGVDPIEPDLLIAETQLHDSPADALKTIAPYVTQIEQSPDARPGALWLYANTLLANNRGGEACAWIDHLLERSASARATAPSLARSIDDLPAARTLLKRTGSFIKDEENSTRFAIVSAWLGLAQQTGTASDAESALAIAAPESARENASANWLLATAEAQRIAGHVQLAEEGLRRAMLRYPDDSNLLNSLAWLLYSTNRSGDEAKNLADRAIDADSNSTSAYETAGRIALAMNRTDDAERYFRRALSISNDNLEALLGLASLQRSRGQQSAANQTIAKIEQIVSDPKIARRLGPELLAQVNSLRNSTNGAVSNAN
ncbi:MAG TPA: tetratricopeptide repeat protein, partial [Tepidisphaeraceae bacterium]|nr:tetratricopeptide repeat protein [Tepidisphaeraceae bacterium]